MEQLNRIGDSGSVRIIGDTVANVIDNPVVTKFLRKMSRLVPTMVNSGAHLMKLMKIRMYLIFIFILFVFSLVVALLIVLIYCIRPKLPGPCHSIDYKTYFAKTYVPDFLKSLKTFNNGLPKYAENLCGSSLAITPTSQFSLSTTSTSSRILQETINATSTIANLDESTLTDNLRLYFSYYQCLDEYSSLPYSQFCPTALANEKKFRESSGEYVVQKNALEKFKTDFLKPIEIIRNSTLAMSTIAATQNLERQPWYSKEASNWILSLHQMRMYLNDYFESMNSMAMNRIEDKTGINIWIIYFLPFMKDIFRHKIPKVWKTLRPEKNKYDALWNKGWTWLGNFIKNLPSKIYNNAFDSSKSRS